MARWRHRSRRTTGAIAEIVGTLMLILIVVAAAIALAAFVASYQKQLQAEEAQAQHRGLESLKILSITPTLNTSSPGEWAGFSFVLASEYINPSYVDSMTVNGAPIRFYWVQNLSSPDLNSRVYDSTNSSNPLILSPHEEVVITVNLTAPGGSHRWFSMFDPSFVLTTSDYVQISLYTALQNTFTQVFLPPTAVAIVSSLTTFTDGTYVNEPVLDGSHSFAAVNDSVVAWNWNVTNATEMISSTASLSSGTVTTGANPITGMAQFPEPIGFVSGTSLWLALTCTCTGGAVSPGTLTFTQSSAPPILTVNFAFTYDVGGSAGTLSISNSGAFLNYSASTYWGGLTPVAATINGPGTVSAGPNLETGQATFTGLPTQFMGVTALSLAITGGTATGFVLAGPAITSQSYVGGVATVDFSFTFNATTPGMLGTTSASGTYTTLYSYAASGEEVVPGYWVTAPAGTSFNIELTIQSSDSLFGTASTTYSTP